MDHTLIRGLRKKIRKQSQVFPHTLSQCQKLNKNVKLNEIIKYWELIIRVILLYYKTEARRISEAVWKNCSSKNTNTTMSSSVTYSDTSWLLKRRS